MNRKKSLLLALVVTVLAAGMGVSVAGANDNCRGEAPTILGTSGNDRIVGTSGDDVINARGGNDVVYGLDGNDIICGGSGDDQLIGGSGADIMDGNGDSDRLVGGPGDDQLEGGSGDDTIRGNLGNDELIGQDGNDKIFGGRGEDQIAGGDGNDLLSGGIGVDAVTGGSGDDRTRGSNEAGDTFVDVDENGRSLVTPIPESGPADPVVPPAQTPEEAPATPQAPAATAAPSTTASPATTAAPTTTTAPPAAPAPTTTRAPAPAPTTTKAPAAPPVTAPVNVSNGGAINPNDWKVNPSFSPSDLPSQAARDAYEDWWTSFGDPGGLWQDSPSDIYAPADIGNTNRNGTYSYARAGDNHVSAIVDFIRTTGDPKALDELVKVSERLRSNLKDHDGRGYVYFEYTAVVRGNSTDNKHNLDDTNWLDEQMLGASISQMARTMHLNRDIDSKAAREADFWFTYLDENFTQKWLYRSTFGTKDEHVPARNLGLQNAVNWDGGVGGSGGNADDITKWAGPDFVQNDGKPRFNDVAGITHEFPAHHFGHPYIMSIYQYHAMGEYFQDMGITPVSGSAQDFLDEANTRARYWDAKVKDQSDGSTDWFLNLNRSNSGLRSDAYSQFVATYMNLLHHEGVGSFASDAQMQRYAKAWYNGNPNSSADVFDRGDTTTMNLMSNASGRDIAFMMRHAGLLACWDNTGVMLDLIDDVIISPTSHRIFANQGKNSTSWHDKIHYNAILSCELS